MTRRRGPIDSRATLRNRSDAQRLPPKLLGGSPERGRVPRQLMEERRQGRILLGALNVFGSKGYSNATVQDLIDETGISRATFYKYFPDRESCLEALSEELLGWLEAEAEARAADADGWPSEALQVLRRLIELLAGDARIARVCGIESALVSPTLDARRGAAIGALIGFLRRGRAHSKRGEELPAVMEEVLVRGALDLATRSAIAKRSPDRLASEISELVLMHYLGSAAARKLVGAV